MNFKITYIRIFKQVGFLILIFLFVGCSNGKSVKVPNYTANEATPTQEASSSAKNKEDAKSVDHLKIHQHEKWTTLLEKHVNENGDVDYKGFVKDSVALNEYLQQLAKHSVNDAWSYNEKKAYWINAYNAFTVKLIADNYPVKSIKDLGGSIYKVNTPWDIKFIKLGDKTYDLNNIEHSILRKDFTDPKIHAAVNCASISCPKLRTEAYIAEKLESQMEDQMRSFINNADKNTIGKNEVKISPIFKWFSGDFTEEGDIIDYLNKYAKVKISAKADINYTDYNWNLNE